MISMIEKKALPIQGYKVWKKENSEQDAVERLPCSVRYLDNLIRALPIF